MSAFHTDPSITLRGLQQPESVGDIFTRFAQLRNMGQQSQLYAQHIKQSQMQLDEQSKQKSEQDALDSLLVKHTQANSKNPYEDALNEGMKTGAIRATTAMQMKTQLAEHMGKLSDEERKRQSEMATRVDDEIGAVLLIPKEDVPGRHQAIQSAIQRASAEGNLSPENANQLAQSIGQITDPDQLEQQLQIRRARAVGSKPLFERETEVLKAKATHEAPTTTEKDFQSFYKPWLEANGLPKNAANEMKARQAFAQGKTSQLLTPEEEAQKKRLAEAGKTPRQPTDREEWMKDHPGATITDYWAAKQGITQTTRSMIESAPGVKDFVGKIRDSVKKMEDRLGPAGGRWAEFWAGKVGANDPDFTRLRTEIGLLQTRLMRMHVGARGGQEMLAHFKDLFDAGKQSPGNLLAAMDVLDEYADDLIKQGKGRGASETAPTRPAPKPFVPF